MNIQYHIKKLCNKKLLWLFLLLCGMGINSVKAEGVELMAQVRCGDTIPVVFLHEIYVYPPYRFKSKAQERFYWRTVRDVKKTLPYAKLIAQEMLHTDSVLATIPLKKDRTAYMNQYERQLFKKYEKSFRSMTAKQGFMLMKLVDRQCDQTSYEVIKYYKGGFVAFFWQGIARLFGNNLKVEFDAEMNEQDRLVERVITLVEAGQL